jgi:transposase
MSHEGYGQKEISEALSISRNTVRNVCKRYLTEGLESAMSEKPRSGAPKRFQGKQLAKLTALACTEAPDGHSQWSLRLLADKAVELAIVDDISHMHVGRILKKTK